MLKHLNGAQQLFSPPALKAKPCQSQHGASLFYSKMGLGSHGVLAGGVKRLQRWSWVKRALPNKSLRLACRCTMKLQMLRIESPPSPQRRITGASSFGKQAISQGALACAPFYAKSKSKQDFLSPNPRRKHVDCKQHTFGHGSKPRTPSEHPNPHYRF